MSKNAFVKINYPKKPKTANTNTSKKSTTNNDVKKPMPEWNDNLNDTEKYKLTSSELVINPLFKNIFINLL